jgi:hypothetical protein
MSTVIEEIITPATAIAPAQVTSSQTYSCTGSYFEHPKPQPTCLKPEAAIPPHQPIPTYTYESYYAQQPQQVYVKPTVPIPAQTYYTPAQPVQTTTTVKQNNLQPNQVYIYTKYHIKTKILFYSLNSRN